uniref:Secreted protein n=1 Tax=Mycobacterium sp. FM10 TaxID=85684 RepID=Q9ZFC2_9MYCO|nr:hypothetical protein [Mycobacterium sp. FM10]
MVFYKTLPVLAVSVAALCTAGSVIAGGTAAAQPPLRHIQYTVGASQDIANAEIYWRQIDPPDWGAYSHNPYEFTPNVEANLGPNQAWVHETWLADPDQWAMVVVGLPAQSTPPLADPGFVCELRVDDVVLATDAGTKGALCSLRPW